MAGGVLTLFVNAALSPFLPVEAAFGELAASAIFRWRLSLAAFGVFLLLAGMGGLYGRHRVRASVFGALGYGLAFAGTAMLFAHEWAQVFFVHHLALVDPAALEAMESVEGLDNLFDAESIATVSVFALGWILFSVSLLIAGTFGRLGPALVIAGFFAVPLFTALAQGSLWGAAAGNVVLSSGWILLGLALMKRGGNE